MLIKTIIGYGQAANDSLTIKALSDSISKYRVIEPDRALLFCEQKKDFCEQKNNAKAHLDACNEALVIAFMDNKLKKIPVFLTQFSTKIQLLKTQLTEKDFDDFINKENRYAILFFQKIGKNAAAISLIEKSINTVKQKKQNNFSDSVSLYFNYYSLSTIYFQQGAYEKAHDFGLIGLNYLLGFKKQNLSANLLFYGNLTEIATKLEKYDKVQFYQNKAEMLFAEVEKKDKMPSGFEYNASNYYYIRISESLEKKDFLNANNYLLKSKKYIIPNTADDINYFKFMGQSYTIQNKYAESDSFFNQALVLAKNIFGERNKYTAEVHTALAKLNLKKQDTLQALLGLQNALIASSIKFDKSDFKTNPSVSDAISKKELLNIVNLKSDILLKLAQTNPDNYLQSALQTAQLGITLMDSIRVDYSSDYDKINLVSNAYPIFEKYIKSAYLLHQKTQDPSYIVAAYQAVEQSKALVLLEGLKGIEAETVLSDADRQSLFQLKADLIALEKKRNDEKNQDLNNANYVQIQNQIFDVNRQFDNLIKTFETRYPAYYKLKFDRQLTNIKQTQALLSANQTLVNYFVGDSSIFVFLIKSNNYELIELKKDFPLDNWVKLLRGSLSADNYQNQADIYADMAFKLYEKLIKPIKSQLTEEITIIPDGILGYIPFEALLTKQPEKAFRFQTHAYLLRDHAINYSFSATLLREMKGKKYAINPIKNILTYAPFFNGNVLKLDSIYSNDLTLRKDFAPLSSSGEEAFSIAKLMGGEALIGKEATDSSFIKNAPNARIVHLATHGKANDKSSDYSYLAFASQNDSLKNALFYVRDLYNLTLNADLVVLSACETGIGKLQRGEGIISLARAFAYAGAKSIVTSLWSVNDAKTKDFMLFFYKNLKKGKSKDAALRDAKLSLMRLKDHPNAHPFFWAGFIGIGDMAKIR